MPDKLGDEQGIETLGRMALGLLALALIVSMALPVILGIILFLLLQRSGLPVRLFPAKPRRLYMILWAAAVVLTIVTFSNGSMAYYFQWLLGLFGVTDVVWTDLPLLPFAAYSLFVASTIGSVGAEWLLAHTPEKIRERLPGFGGTDDVLNVDPSRARDVSSYTLAAPPLQVSDRAIATGPSDDHDPDSEIITLGLDINRRPVHLHTGDIGTHGIVLGTTGTGKALALHTPVPTPDGWTTMGDLSVGDYVFDENGQPTRVTFATEVQHHHDCFDVVFDNGEVITADADHRWLTWTRESWLTHIGQGAADLNSTHQPSVVTTAEIFDTLTEGGHPNHMIPVAASRIHPERELPVDPYHLGVRLANGYTSDAPLTSEDPDAPTEMDELTAHPDPSLSGTLPTIGGGSVSPAVTPGAVATLDRPSGASEHIPHIYLHSSHAQRLALLQGLMDTAGRISARGTCEFTTTSASLATAVSELLSSLGIKNKVRTSQTRWFGRTARVRHRVCFTTNLEVFRTEKNKLLLPSSTTPAQEWHAIVDVRPVDSVPVRCITVDSPNHLYLAGRSGIPTHNTITLEALIQGLLDRGYSGCVLDLKEDIGPGGLAHFLETYAAANSVEYQHWALSYAEEDFTYYLDPLYGLDLDLAINMIASMQDFEAPHWEAMCKQILGQLLYLMYTAHEIAPDKFPIPSLRDVGRILSGDISTGTQSMRAHVLAALKDTGQVNEADFSTLSNPSPNHRQASGGLGARISAAYESNAGRTGLRAGGTRKPIRLADNGLVYIGLDSLGQPDTSRVVSSSILAGYSALASRRKDDPRVKSKQDRRFLVVDEAAAVNTAMVKNLLSRARSAGIAVILATQGAVDWGLEWPAMVNNTNFSIIMGQQDTESARLAAELLGRTTRTDESQSLQDGEVIRTNLRDIEDFRVPPENLRGLQTGQAYLRVRTRFGDTRPYMTWLAVKLPEHKQTVEGHRTSVDLRHQKQSGVPFKHALPDFSKNPDPNPLAPPPTDTTPPPPPLSRPVMPENTPQPPKPRPGTSPGSGAAPRPRTGAGSGPITPPAQRPPNPSEDLDDDSQQPRSSDGGWNPGRF